MKTYIELCSEIMSEFESKSSELNKQYFKKLEDIKFINLNKLPYHKYFRDINIVGEELLFTANYKGFQFRLKYKSEWSHVDCISYDCHDPIYKVMLGDCTLKFEKNGGCNRHQFDLWFNKFCSQFEIDANASVNNHIKENCSGEVINGVTLINYDKEFVKFPIELSICEDTLCFPDNETTIFSVFDNAYLHDIKIGKREQDCNHFWVTEVVINNIEDLTWLVGKVFKYNSINMLYFIVAKQVDSELTIWPAYEEIGLNGVGECYIASMFEQFSDYEEMRHAHPALLEKMLSFTFGKLKYTDYDLELNTHFMKLDVEEGIKKSLVIKIHNKLSEYDNGISIPQSFIDEICEDIEHDKVTYVPLTIEADKCSKGIEKYIVSTFIEEN